MPELESRKMSLAKTLLNNELNCTAAIVDGTIWEVRRRKEDENYFRWYGKTFGIAKGKTLGSLEEDYIEANQNRRNERITREIKLAEFVIKNVIGRNPYKSKIRGVGVIEEILHNAFACCSSLFELKQGKNQNHEVRVEGKSYSIGKEVAELGELGRDYERKLEDMLAGENYDRRMTEAAKKGKHYDKKENIGFEKTEEGFFVYTVVKPYALYEKCNNKHYGFGEAKIGIKLDVIDEDVMWHDAVVMNRYAHPALPGAEMYQRICTGGYSYEKARERYKDKGKQIRAALSEAVRMIERGYFSANGSWNKLTETRYKELEIKNIEGWRITNV